MNWRDSSLLTTRWLAPGCTKHGVFLIRLSDERVQTMKLSDQIKAATTIEEMASIAKNLMQGNGPKLKGQRIWFSHNDVKRLFEKYRPEVDFAELDEILSNEICLLSPWAQDALVYV